VTLSTRSWSVFPSWTSPVRIRSPLHNHSRICVSYAMATASPVMVCPADEDAYRDSGSFIAKVVQGNVASRFGAAALFFGFLVEHDFLLVDLELDDVSFLVVHCLRDGSGDV
jgi:hypothetical protein